MPPLDAYALNLRGGRALVLRALVGLTGEAHEKRTTWIDLAGVGEWKGHQDGEFTLTVDDFASCVAAFEAEATPIPFDYDHASTAPDGFGTPASGWVRGVEVRGERLWVLGEFTERAASMIRAGEYRFTSGVFLFDRPDKASGKPIRCRLHSVALTNTPFLDGQQPIALSATSPALRALTPGGTMKIKREALLALLEKIEGDEIEAEQLHAAVEAAAAEAIAIDGPPPEDESADAPPLAALPAKDEKPVDGKGDAKSDKPADDKKLADDAAALAGDVSQEGASTDFVPAAEDVAADAGAMVASRLMEASGLDEAGLLAAIETNLDAIVAALQGVGAASDALPMSVKLLSDSLVTANAELTRFRANAAATKAADKKRELDGEIGALVTAGKILPGAKDEWRALAAMDLPRFRALAAKLPQVVPLGDEVGGIEAAAASQLDNVIDMSSPEVRALSAKFDAWGIKDPAIREKHMRAAAERNRSAG